MTAYVVIELTEYQQLRAAASHHTPARCGGPGTNALAAAVAAITAYQAGIQLPTDADPGKVIRYLAVITATILNATTSDNGADLLQALGLEATETQT